MKPITGVLFRSILVVMAVFVVSCTGKTSGSNPASSQGGTQTQAEQTSACLRQYMPVNTDMTTEALVTAAAQASLHCQISEQELVQYAKNNNFNSY